MPTTLLNRADPARLGAERKAFTREMQARFRRLAQAVTKLLVEDDVLAQKQDLLMLVNRAWEFHTDEQKLTAFSQWLTGEVDKKLLTTDSGDGKPWTGKWVDSAYRKGTNRAFIDGKKAGYAKEILPGLGTAREEFIKSAFSQPQRLSKIAFLSTRSFEELRGITSAMSQRMNRTFAQGIANGLGARQLARRLTEDVEGISRSRAVTLARTELAAAHAEGQLDTFEELGIDEVNVFAEWSTAGDDEVCPLCELDGAVMPVKEARGLLPRHPNCRCAWLPATDEDTKARRAAALRKVNTSMRRETKRRSNKAARGNSRWAGKHFRAKKLNTDGILPIKLPPNPGQDLIDLKIKYEGLPAGKEKRLLYRDYRVLRAEATGEVLPPRFHKHLKNRFPDHVVDAAGNVTRKGKKVVVAPPKPPGGKKKVKKPRGPKKKKLSALDKLFQEHPELKAFHDKQKALPKGKEKTRANRIWRIKRLQAEGKPLPKRLQAFAEREGLVEIHLGGKKVGGGRKVQPVGKTYKDYQSRPMDINTKWRGGDIRTMKEDFANLMGMAVEDIRLVGPDFNLKTTDLRRYETLVKHFEAQSKAVFDAHKDIMQTFPRLVDIYERHKLSQLSLGEGIPAPQSNWAGWYNTFGRRLNVKTGMESQLGKENIKNIGIKNIFGEFNWVVDDNASPRATYRHEFGHHVHLGGLTTRDQAKAWTNIYKKRTKNYWKTHLSKYGGSNEKELFAESFNAFVALKQEGLETKGELPQPIFDFFENMIGTPVVKKKVKKGKRTVPAIKEELGKVLGIDKSQIQGSHKRSLDAAIDAYTGINERHPNIWQRIQRTPLDTLQVKKDLISTNSGKKIYGNYSTGSHTLRVVSHDPVTGHQRVLTRNAKVGLRKNFKVEDSLQGTLRHEMGHHMHRNVLDKEAQREWNALWVSRRKESWQSSVSVYGGANEAELFAESFSAYTHVSEEATERLPQEIQDFFAKHVDVAEDAKAKAKAEAERKAKAEAERKSKELAEKARKATEKREAERKAKAKAEAERKAKAEAERKAKAKAEAERKAKEEARKAAEAEKAAEKKRKRKERRDKRKAERAKAEADLGGDTKKEKKVTIIRKNPPNTKDADFSQDEWWHFQKQPGDTSNHAVDVSNDDVVDMLSMKKSDKVQRVVFDDPRVKDIVYNTHKDMAERFPGFKEKYEKKPLSLIRGRAEKSSVNGSYGANTRYMRLNTTPQHQHTTNKVVIGQSQWEVEVSVRGVYRHEMGHHMHETVLGKAAQRDWKSIWKARNKQEWQSTLSRYGATNEFELFAEAFSAFTSPVETEGGLPDDVLSFMTKHFG